MFARMNLPSSSSEILKDSYSRLRRFDCTGNRKAFIKPLRMSRRTVSTLTDKK
jgi:hypothetical protein